MLLLVGALIFFYEKHVARMYLKIEKYSKEALYYTLQLWT